MLTEAMNEFEMSPEEFVMFRDYIHEKSGIFFAENKVYLLKNRIQKRMSELDMRSVRDYFYQVKYDTSLREFNRLMELVTTNETSFFRNEPQLLSFSDEVLPKLIAQKLSERGSKSIRIWSAGCSTGEEPYTLAIILLEALRGQIGWTIEIIANDISEQVLQRARQGEYSGITLRNLKPGLLERYFTKHGESYRVTPELQSLVKFTHLNLNDSRKICLIGNADVIFCRNVMIYFSDEVKRQLVRGFYNALKPGGYLYIGHSETLHGISKAFKLVYFKNALVYQKEAVGVEPECAPARQTFVTAQTTGQAPVGLSRALDLLSQIRTGTTKK